MRILLTGYLFAVFIPFYAYSAPRSKAKSNLPQTVYDQKQTGDYNIQLHLKDFQIIALLSDESLGGLGDYDYNYDYTDFTVKPPAHNITTTVSTSQHEQEIVTPSGASSSTEKPSNNEPPNTIVLPSTSSKPVELLSTSLKPTSIISTEKPQDSVTSVVENVPKNITQKILSDISNSPDKIKVQIIQAPEVNPHLEIVPADDMGPSNSPDFPLGEVVHYRKCASGYARDKRGRCRRVRRPGTQGPSFDFSRLASNLAAKFRQASGDEDSTSSLSASSSSASASEESPEK